MGIMTKISELKAKTITNFKKSIKEKKKLKLAEKKAYKEAYAEQRIKSVREDAKKDAKAGGKFKRMLSEITLKGSSRRNTNIKTSSYNPWTSSGNSSGYNPWTGDGNKNKNKKNPWL